MEIQAMRTLCIFGYAGRVLKSAVRQPTGGLYGSTPETPAELLGEYVVMK
jgi:hypothetical protein